MSSVVSTSMVLRLLQVLSLVWAGLVLGISFLEAPVKFTAPSVTREIGLDVGRHVFSALNKVEIGLGVITLGGLFAGTPAPPVRWVLIGVLVVLSLQAVWLLPVLNGQAKSIIEGSSAPNASYAHVGYIFLEVAKVAGLLFVGGQLLFS